MPVFFFNIIFSSLSLFSTPPVEWKIDNYKFTQADVQLLPMGSGLSTIVENYSVGGLVQNLDIGGFSSTEDQKMSLHGSSYLWQKYYVNHVNISNPAFDGQSMVQIPNSFLDELELSPFLHNKTQGYHYTFYNTSMNSKEQDTLTKNQYSFSTSYIKTIQGQTWMPEKTFDREPATLWGAPEESRSFEPSFESNASVYIPFSNPILFSINYLHYNKNFVDVPDTQLSQQGTILITQTLNNSNTENNSKQNKSSHQYKTSIPKDSWIFLYQFTKNPSLGIEKGLDIENTLDLNRHSVVAILNKTKKNYSLYTGIGYSFDKRENNYSQYNQSLEENVLFGDIEIPQENHSFFLESVIEEKKTMKYFNFKNTMRFEGVITKNDVDDTAFTQTYSSLPLTVLTYDLVQQTYEYQLKIQPELFYNKSFSLFQFNGSLGLSSQSIYNKDSLLLHQIDPLIKLKLAFLPTKNIRITTAVSHLPIDITNQTNDFLNKNSLSGYESKWTDSNNDMIYTTDETGAVLRRTGGLYHNIDDDIKNPVQEEFYLGYSQKIQKNWMLLFNATFVLYRNLYSVQFDENFDANYVLTSDGYYDRELGTYGEENYTLTNLKENSFSFFLELQILRTKIKKRWFFNLSLALYNYFGNTIAGNSTSADIGIINESSTDPNNSLFLFGRTVQDRAYKIKWTFGGEIIDGLVLSNVFHYRDGEPFSKMKRIDGLTQGPIIIPIQERGGGWNGAPRYTFFLNWDVKLLYGFHLSNKKVFVSLDFYNILNFRTELNEYIIDGLSYRDPLEMITERTIRFSLKIEL